MEITIRSRNSGKTKAFIQTIASQLIKNKEVITTAPIDPFRVQNTLEENHDLKTTFEHIYENQNNEEELRLIGYKFKVEPSEYKHTIEFPVGGTVRTYEIINSLLSGNWPEGGEFITPPHKK